MQEYTKTDQQLHWICQIIAKANRTFVQKEEDDSHTNLYFDRIGNKIVGRWIETPHGKLILSLVLSNLHLEWLNESLDTTKSVSSIGRHASEIEQELTEGMQKLGLDPDGFMDKLHFEIPSYTFAHEPIQEIGIAKLNEWKHYRQLANEACVMVMGYLQVFGEIRIWPHHFDTGIYIEPNERIGIGFGLAMEDSMAGSPYFYVSGYPKKGEINYVNLPQLNRGKWEVDGQWKGALLPLSEIKNLSYEEQQKSILEFSKYTLDWFI
ncbi:MAG: hypothetical protein KAQ62_27590 [Cyclobacteriaceae bacterium]|nr:hypothetical protein [Cyclobacteriaceae bacterium]